MSRRRMFPGGLRAQLLLGLCLLLAATFALVAIIVENVVNRRLQEARMQEGDRLAAAALALGETETLTARDLERVSMATGAAAMLVAVEGRTFRHGGGGAAARLSELAASGSSPSRRILQVEGIPHLFTVARAEAPPRRVAAVALSMEDVERRTAQTRQFLWGFFIVDAVFILALGYAFFTFLIVRPIRAIGVATERASEGDLASAIAVLPRNEFGQVGRSFNKMLARLEDNRIELERRLDELERANDEIKSTRDTLIRSEKLASVGQLAAGVAHEVGNPLAAISGYNDLLRDGDLEPEQVADLLERTHVQLERIRSIIRNLLDFSRPDDGVPEPTSLATCVSEAISLVSALPQARDAAFEMGTLQGPAVVAVPSQVVQVLVNLFINALDAMEEADIEQPKVRVWRVDGSSEVALHVADSGPGLDHDVQNRVFDPFFTTKEPGEGTGLGLSISLRIMESFGGDISAETPDDGGAQFCLRFLRADDRGEPT